MDKNKIAIGAGVTIGVALVVFLVYKAMTKEPDFNAVPPPPEGLHIRQMAMRLHSDMDGINVTRDMDMYNEFLSMSNADFVAVYNDFGELFFAGSGQTLRQWIEGENFALTSSVFTPWSIYAGTEMKTALLNRFNELNLQ